MGDELPEGRRQPQQETEAHEKPKSGLGYYLGIIPGLYHSMAAKVGGYDGAKAKGHDFADWLGRALMRAASWWWLRAIGLIAIVWLAWTALSAFITYAKSEHAAIVAIATAAYAITAFVQAVTTYYLFKLTHRGTQQTDRIIEHMRQEQRPWLAIVDTTLTPPEAGKQRAAMKFTLINTGKAPGMLYASRVWPGVMRPIPGLIEEAQKNLAVVHINETSASVVPPSPARVDRYAHFDIELLDKHIEAINKEELRYVLIGSLVYTDVTGGKYETGFMFHWDPSRKALSAFGGPNVNYMK